MNLTVKLKYSCRGCGLHRVEVEAPARTTEDLKVWMEQIAALAVARDHAKRSPFCRETTMSELLIPMTGTEKVGGAVVQ